jgi:hypothetical protein
VTLVVPSNVAAAIAEHGITPEQGRFAADDTCEGAAFHSPHPLTVREVPLSLAGAPDGPMACLCPTCAENLKALQGLLRATSGDLPWVVRREFGNKLRALAMKGLAWDERSNGG